MKYAKLENNIVVQIQPNKEKGFVEVDDTVVCGMVLEDGLFTIPINKQSEEEILQNKLNEAKSYLLSTDYKMTVDYFATLIKEQQDDLIKLRAEARQFIRDNEK